VAANTEASPAGLTARHSDNDAKTSKPFSSLRREAMCESKASVGNGQATVTSTEHIVGATPLVIRRRVKWGECDPAGVVYTVVFAEYVISAAELFYGSVFSNTAQRSKHELGFGTPTRALEFDFRRPLWPDDEFDMVVTLVDIRTRTYVLHITGRTLEGDDVFHAALTPICVAHDTRKAIAIPPPFRSALELYRGACSKTSPDC
jgi:acyl-CoA thioesterase FadM